MLYHCATRVYKYWCRISDIGKTFIPISDIISNYKHFSPILDVPISGSVRCRWSQISDWVPTYVHIYGKQNYLVYIIFSNCCRFKRKTEDQAIFLSPFNVCSSGKRKFVVCPFADETNRSYPYANRLNGLNNLCLQHSYITLM